MILAERPHLWRALVGAEGGRHAPSRLDSSVEVMASQEISMSLSKWPKEAARSAIRIHAICAITPDRSWRPGARGDSSRG